MQERKTTSTKKTILLFRLDSKLFSNMSPSHPLIILIFDFSFIAKLQMEHTQIK